MTGGRSRSRPVDRAGLLVALAFAAWAVLPLLALLVDAATNGESFTGATGPLTAADQLRFMAWLREAGAHTLISNDFGLQGGERLLLQPLYLVSGVLWKIGASPHLAYLVWLPIACAALVVGFTAYVRRRLTCPGARAAALALALFYFTPLLPFLDWAGIASPLTANQLVIVAGAAAPFWETWGYFSSAIGLGLMPLYLLGLERVAEGDAEAGRASGLTMGAGLAVAWLHPWGGLTLLLLTAAVIRPLVVRAPWRAAGLLAAPALPLAGYAILVEANPALGLGNWQASFFPDRPAWTLLIALLPLVAAAFLGLRGRKRGTGERLLRLWPLAALATYLVLGHSARLQALAGITLPLAVLAARGWPRLTRRPALGLAALAVATVPGMLYAAQTMRDSVRAEYAPYELGRGEADLLAYLDRSGARGGVLASSYLSPAVPALAGRSTYAGLPSNDTSARVRARDTDRFLAGRLGSGATRDLLTRANVPFIAVDCRHRIRFDDVLAPLGYRSRRFGCARLYERHLSSR